MTAPTSPASISTATVMRTAWQIASRCVRALRDGGKRRTFLSYSLKRAWAEAKRAAHTAASNMIMRKVSSLGQGGASTRQYSQLRTLGVALQMTSSEFFAHTPAWLATQLISQAEAGVRLVVVLA